MTANFLKDYMDLDEFLAVKDLCTGLSRTESDYSEDEIDQDIANLVDDEDVPPFYTFPPSNIPQLSPDCFGGSTSDTDEGRGESVSSENPASLSSSESLNSNETERASPKKRKRKSTVKNDDAQKTSAPRRRRRKAEDTKEKQGNTTAGSDEGKQPRKISRQTVNDDVKDEKYWERRRKNNQAAKRSRDLKRQKELCVAERAASLEDENRQLREEVQKLRDYLRTLDEKMDKSSTDSQ